MPSTSVTTIRPLSDEDLSREMGILFPKGFTIEAADFDKFLGIIDPTLFTGDELFGWFMVVDVDTSIVYDVEIEWLDGRSSIISVPAWTYVAMRGRRILSANTTATRITVFAGQ